MRPYPLFFLVGTALIALPLCAQRAPSDVAIAAERDSLAPGVPVRLRLRRGAAGPFAPDGPSVRIGTFTGWRADTLLLRFRPYGPPLAVPTGIVRSLERGVGRRPSIGGAMAGSVKGLAVGFLSGALVSAIAKPSPAEGPSGAVPPVLGGAAGFVLGAAYGYERGSPQWVRVPLR